MDIWLAVGLILGLIGVGVSVYYGRRSPTAVAVPGPRGPEVAVRVTNSFPVYDLPDGRQQLGDHHVTVEAVNRGDQPITVTGWGIKLPGDRRVVVTRPVTWSTRLPHELRPGAAPVQLPMPAEDLRRIAREDGISYDDMWPYVTLADGQDVSADRSVPLA